MNEQGRWCRTVREKVEGVLGSSMAIEIGVRREGGSRVRGGNLGEIGIGAGELRSRLRLLCWEDQGEHNLDIRANHGNTTSYIVQTGH
jgi:hypothetical protein